MLALPVTVSLGAHAEQEPGLDNSGSRIRNTTLQPATSSYWSHRHSESLLLASSGRRLRPKRLSWFTFDDSSPNIYMFLFLIRCQTVGLALLLAWWPSYWPPPLHSHSPTPGRRSKPVPDVTTAAHLHHSLPVRSSFYCHAIYLGVYRLTIPWPSLACLPRPHITMTLWSDHFPTHQEIQLVRKWAIIRKNTSVSSLWDRVWNAAEAFIAFFNWEFGKTSSFKVVWNNNQTLML